MNARTPDAPEPDAGEVSVLRRAAAALDEAQYVPGNNVALTRSLSLLLFNEANAMEGAASREQHYNGARRDLLVAVARSIPGADR